MANTGQFTHLDQDQAWAYVHAAKCGDESGLQAVIAWSNEAKCELAAVGLFGRRQDEQDFKSCLEYYTAGGLPPTWPVDDVQRGLEKLGVPDRAPPQPQPAQPTQLHVAQPIPAPQPEPAPSPAAPPSPAPPAQPPQPHVAQAIPAPASSPVAPPSPGAPVPANTGADSSADRKADDSADRDAA